MDRHAFLDPPVLFRPIAFWSLNDRLEEDELVRQIDGMKAAGWGGFFFHARGGLETPYMGEEWMRLFSASAEAARERGMKAWIYDENGWPSGTCGSLIAGLDPAYRETHLFFAFDRIPHDEADVLWRRRYLTDRRRGRLWDAYRLDRPEPPREFVPDEGDDCPPDRRVLWIYVWRAPACNPRFGGKSYVDLMNPDAADAFFASTHQQYIDRFASDMGRDKLIPAVFFDDLTIKWDLMGAKGNAVPWTERMPALFADEYGYDLLGRLPDLFFDTPTAARTRADYIRLVTRLFADNFAGRIARRCEEYDLGVTGHLMGNEGLYSDAMLIYCYQRMPAVDHLSCGRGDFRKLRRIRSVADQFEKPATLCEAFAGAGHDMTPESQRRQTDYLCLGGVSTLVPHVAQYSMRGTRKFDHPPTFSDHDPWWRVNAPLADYQARLGCALYSARGAARVLVIDPIESKYIANAPGMGRENAVAKKLDRLTDRVERTLLGCHCEFAYGSEELLSRFGKTAGGRLCLGRGAYDAVILPSCVTLRRSTLDLLSRLIDEGGRVLVVGSRPTLCDGAAARPEIAEALARAQVINLDRLAEAVADFSLSVLGPDGEDAVRVHTAQRWADGETICFLVNSDYEHPARGAVRLPCPVSAEAADLYTGTFLALPAKERGGAWDVPFDLPAGGSRLILLRPCAAGADLCAAVPRTPPVLPPPEAPTEILPLPDAPAMTPGAPNVLLIDRVRVARGDGQPGEEVLTAAVRDRGGMTVSAVFEARGWDGTGGAVLVEDAPAWASISLNGVELERETDRRFFDRSSRALDIAGAVREGENRLTLTAAEGARIEMQPLYILGPFGVWPTGDGTRYVIRGEMPRTLGRDLSREGMPFYLGDVRLSWSVEVPARLCGARKTCRLVLDGVEAAAAEVRVGDGAPVVLFDRPFEADLTGRLVPGKNRVEVRLCGTLRNFLGPHHTLLPADTPFITPADFFAVSEMTEAYSVAPFGLLGGALCFFDT